MGLIIELIIMKGYTTNTEITFDNMPQALAKVYDEVITIRAELSELQKNYEPKSPPEYLTASEVAAMLKCDLSTVHNWNKRGKLKKYGIGHRAYYLRHEVEAAIIPIG